MTTATPASLRLFVAIELPEAWLAALAGLQQRMKDALAKDPLLTGVRVRWARSKGIHLTLKFIGEAPPERLAPIREQLARAVPESPGITLALGWAGSFADRRAPRVIWAGVQSEQYEKLRALADSIETWLAAAGVPRERRGFAAHLTLARLPNDLPDDARRRIAELTTAVEAPSVPPFEVEAVSLMQSLLGPNCARYERLGRWPA
jgi:2'-5' RNA ligase